MEQLHIISIVRKFPCLPYSGCKERRIWLKKFLQNLTLRHIWNGQVWRILLGSQQICCDILWTQILPALVLPRRDYQIICANRRCVSFCLCCKKWTPKKHTVWTSESSTIFSNIFGFQVFLFDIVNLLFRWFLKCIFFCIQTEKAHKLKKCRC